MDDVSWNMSATVKIVEYTAVNPLKFGNSCHELLRQWKVSHWFKELSGLMKEDS